MIIKSRKEIGELLGIKIHRDTSTGCWFINSRDHSIYQTLKGKPAHRVIYELCVGPIIPGRLICHSCDRKGCICPGHLWQGTQSDNMRDAREKNRSTYGLTRMLRKR